MYSLWNIVHRMAERHTMVDTIGFGMTGSADLGRSCGCAQTATLAVGAEVEVEAETAAAVTGAQTVEKGGEGVTEQ